MRDRPTQTSQASQVMVEILPNRLRALLMAAIFAAVLAFVYFCLTNQIFDDNSFKSFVDHPGYYAGDLFDNHGSLLVISVCALILASNIYTVGSTLMPWPRPRLRITRERFEARSVWHRESFAWSEFGCFSVKNVRAGTVRVRALPRGAADPDSIVDWFELKKTPELLSFDLQVFVPLMKNNVAEGEELVRWILDLRDGHNTPPPEMMTVRMTAVPVGRINSATGNAAKAALNQAVVRR